MDTMFVAVSIFLFIFTLTAILTLLSLIGKVKIQPQYQKQLFRLVILQVAAVVIGFVANTVKPSYLSRDMLISPQAWDSSYPERSWRTKARFVKKDGKVEFLATTYLVRSDSAETPLIHWHSVEPFKLTELSKEVSFRASFKWTDEAARVYPNLQYKVAKPDTGMLKLITDIGIRGSWVPDGTNENWGFMFDRTWQ